MNRYTILLSLAVLTLSQPAYCGPWSAALKPKAATVEKQPIRKSLQLYYFSAKWCQPCQKDQAPQMARLDKAGWKFAMYGSSETGQILVVDCDKHADLVRKYGVTEIPAFVLLEDGEPVDGFTGVKTAEEIAGMYNDRLVPPKVSAISRGVYEQILANLGDSGSFNFTPTKPAAIAVDGVTSITVTSLQGSYARNGDKIDVTFTGQQPRFHTKKFWMRVNGTMQGVTIDPATNAASVKTSHGVVKVTLEFEE